MSRWAYPVAAVLSGLGLAGVPTGLLLGWQWFAAGFVLVCAGVALAIWRAISEERERAGYLWLRQHPRARDHRR